MSTELRVSLYSGNAYAQQPVDCCELRWVGARDSNATHQYCVAKLKFRERPFSGLEPTLNGKRFDAKIAFVDNVYEVKTWNLDKWNPWFRRVVIEGRELPELERQHSIAQTCGYIMTLRYGDPRVPTVLKTMSFDVLEEDPDCVDPW